jgi:MORN repeat variant
LPHFLQFFTKKNLFLPRFSPFFQHFRGVTPDFPPNIGQSRVQKEHNILTTNVLKYYLLARNSGKKNITKWKLPKKRDIWAKTHLLMQVLRWLLMPLFFALAFSAAAQALPLRRSVITQDSGVTQKFELRVVAISPVPRQGRIYHFLQNNKIQALESGYTGALLDGKYTSFNALGNVLEQGQYSAGLKTGTWLRWHSNGMLRKKTQWKGGVPHGAFVAYDQEGQIQKKGRYKNGLLSGSLQLYEGGVASETQHYTKGVLNKQRPKSPKKAAKK